MANKKGKGKGYIRPDHSYYLDDVYYPDYRKRSSLVDLKIREMVLDFYSAVAVREGMSIKVEKPGFFSWPTLLKNTKYRAVFFSKPGRYSFKSIYNHINNKYKNNFKEGLLSKNDNRYIAELKESFSYPASGREKLKSDLASGGYYSWNDVRSSLSEAYNNKIYYKLSNENLFSPPILRDKLVNGRYLLMVQSYGDVYVVTKDGPILADYVGKSSVDKILYSIDEYISYNLVNDSVYNSTFCFAVDLKTNSVVYSERVEELAIELIGHCSNSWKGYGDIYSLYSPEGLVRNKEFSEGVNKYFSDSGFPGIKVKNISPVNVEVMYYPYNYSDDSYNDFDEEVSYNVMGFTFNVTYNGLGIIDKHQVYARKNDDNSGYTLIKSYWCQRISHWSKYHDDVVDQRYDIWPLVDWITGPFAEMQGLSFDEAPAIFMGQNKEVSVDRKKNAIADLKKKLKRKKQ